MKKFRVLFGSFIFSLAAFSVPCGISPAEAAEYSESCDAQITELKDDCTALESLYNATGGDSWKDKTGWKTTAPLENWHGVTVADNRVFDISLGKNNLSGTVPDLGALTELQELLLYDNSLSGEIPDLSALTKLMQLHFNNNGLNGTITPSHLPASLGRLDLYNNRLSGTIPDLSGLKDIQEIHLGRNRLSGEIPDLSELENLEELYLGGNSLTGTIDASKLPASLKQLALGLNSLSGEIPDLCTLPDLQLLYLFDNNLSGEIPDLSNLNNLERLYLYNNRLSGEIPDLSNLNNFERLYLSGNSLTGTIDASKLPASLKFLNLRSNSLSGTVPDLSLTSLYYLDLSANALTGTINASKLPTSLQLLYLFDNNLSGEIPDLRTLGSLWWLNLHSNSLSGGIPVSNLPKNLSWLYLHNNKLTGSATALSPDLSNLATLKELSLWGNTDPAGTITLHDSVKMSVVDRAALKMLYYDNGGSGWSNRAGWPNNFLPLEQWHGVTTDAESGRVKALDLSGNGLENPVSNSLEALGSLAALNLSDNANLSGTLPVRLKDISGLLRLDIRCTDVSIPSSNDFNTWLNSLGSGFMKGCCPSGVTVTGVKASGSFVANDNGSEFQIKVSWDEIPNATYTVTWEDSPQLGFSGVVGPANKSYYDTDGDKISYTIFGHYSHEAPAVVTYTVSLTANVDGCEDVSYGPVRVSTGGSAAPDPGGGAPGGGAPGGDNRDDTCPDYSPVVTARDVERAKDPGTLAAFVKEARTGVGTLLRNAGSEEEGIRNLAECFGADGDWKHGSVHLFMISADEDRKFFLAPGDSDLAGAALDVEDENGCDVGEEILRAAGGEELQCGDLGLAGDDPGPGFVQYLWRDPDDPGGEGYDSPRLSYVEEIRFERFLPSRSFVLGSGYYPEISVPGPEGGTSGSGGGCALAGETDARNGAFIGLLLNVFAIGCAVFLGRGVLPWRSSSRSPARVQRGAGG